MRGWVEHSARKYIPGILSTLEKVTVISARGNYEKEFPGQYHEWKVQAFLEVRRQLNSQIVTNLISLGDSTIEMDAVHVMGREFSQALVKTIKFREIPSPDELAKQLDLVHQKFPRICLNARNLKIGLERRWPAMSDSSAPQSNDLNSNTNNNGHVTSSTSSPPANFSSSSQPNNLDDKSVISPTQDQVILNNSNEKANYNNNNIHNSNKTFINNNEHGNTGIQGSAVGNLQIQQAFIRSQQQQ